VSPVLQEDSEHYQGPRDYTRDPAFVQASPERKHEFLMKMDQNYASAPPERQQAFIKSMTPSNPSSHWMGKDNTIPITGANGRVYQGTPAEGAMRDWSGPVAKVLASMLAGQAAGAATGAAGGGGLLQAGARAGGAGAVTGATEPGSFTDKLAAGAKGAAWGLGGEGVARLGNAIVTAPSIGRFLGRMSAEPGTPAVPPSNPITSATVLHDMGSAQPAGSPFAPRPILGPNGQAVSAVQAPAVENQLRTVSPQTPVPTGPAKDFLVTRTPSPGSPAVPESFLSKLLKTGAPAGVAQDEDVQKGTLATSLGFANWLKEKLGLNRDPNHTTGGG
jgi:hypothetical protein